MRNYLFGLGSKYIEKRKNSLSGLEKEMDSKREELRTLVGERYRDLMEAANTIAQVWSLTHFFCLHMYIFANKYH